MYGYGLVGLDKDIDQLFDRKIMLGDIHNSAKQGMLKIVILF